MKSLECTGIATAHSHAFQRALRGRTQERVEGGSFWSWRGAMYAAANRIDPDELYDLSHFAFIELARCGVTAVGEFHYLHHDRNGAPYRERTLLAESVIRAARDAGLRITLLRVLYQRAGFGAELERGQARFVDADIEHALADIEALIARHRGDPAVRIGIAPHSSRAVSREWLERAASFARARDLPFHIHVGEQKREVRECLAEHGMRPVELLAEVEALDSRTIAVHATHLSPSEIALLGTTTTGVCICRSTERDLADGSPEVGALLRAGVRLSAGVDSHASSDPFEEARAIELDERTRTDRRPAALDAHDLLAILGTNGYAAIGMSGLENEDRVEFDPDDPAIVGAPDSTRAIAWAASPRAVRNVSVAGRRIVEDGIHPRQSEARARFESVLSRLF